MERLTDKKEADVQRRKYEIRLKQGYPRNIPEERFLRLAAYEDTGLEPEEIFSAVDMAKIACALRELNVYKELGSIDCLRKLAGGPGETSTITNGGKIRAMDDDRLAQEILRRWRAEMEAGKFEDISTRWCDMKGGCVSSKGYPRPCTEDRLLACIKRWLQQPAEG